MKAIVNITAKYEELMKYDPMSLIYDVLDTLVEEGETNKHLLEAANKLYRAKALLERRKIDFHKDIVYDKTTSVIYKPYCENCKNRLFDMEVIPGEMKNTTLRAGFYPPQCPNCGKVFTSAQIPMKYSVKEE